MFAPVKEPILNSERSSIGRRWRDSTATNAMSSTAAAANSPTISADAQPRWFALDQRVAEREQPDRRR